MDLHDVNVLIHAFRADSAWHRAARGEIQRAVNGVADFAVSSVVVSAFLRIVTHPGAARFPPDKLSALAFANAIVTSSRARPVVSGSRHWEYFAGLVRATGVHGNVVPDAYLSALAIEHDCEFVTFDQGFARFQGLRWRLVE